MERAHGPVVEAHLAVLQEGVLLVHLVGGVGAVEGILHGRVAVFEQLLGLGDVALQLGSIVGERVVGRHVVDAGGLRVGQLHLSRSVLRHLSEESQDVELTVGADGIGLAQHNVVDALLGEHARVLLGVLDDEVGLCDGLEERRVDAAHGRLRVVGRIVVVAQVALGIALGGGMDIPEVGQALDACHRELHAVGTGRGHLNVAAGEGCLESFLGAELPVFLLFGVGAYVEPVVTRGEHCR